MVSDYVSVCTVVTWVEVCVVGVVRVIVVCRLTTAPCMLKGRIGLAVAGDWCAEGIRCLY